MSTYSDNALAYLDAGWTCVLPVPVETKFPPPSGYSGNEGPDTDRATVESFRAQYPSHSILMRMPAGVIGLDVDHYDKVKTLPDGTTTIVEKRGADDLARAEADWGPLPATWRSSARELPSGIRFFRVPVEKYRAGIGDIDTIQRHHRYAVVAPSLHTEINSVYVWYRPDGSKADPGEIPNPADFPELPLRWLEGMRKGASKHQHSPASTSEAAELLNAIANDPRPMCSMMEIAANRAVAQLHAANSGSRHDTAMARTMRIVGLAAEGHTGGVAALQRTKDAWDVVTAGEHREYEFDSLVNGAAAQAAGGIAQPRELDPCDGAAGAGIELVKDPGEGSRAITLIVEGLDDARMCAEHATADVAVLGIAGRESWRGTDGIPLAELRVVAGTAVVVMMGPDVARDRDTYMSALDLAEASKAKGAEMVKYTQPTGASGARVSAYLNSLEEVERAPALGHMLDLSKSGGTTDKPWRDKPKPSKQTLGADDTGELPPTDDTSLGTDWADKQLAEFRYLITDKVWLAYRDGRWSRDGAESTVGFSVMRFLSDASGAIQVARDRAKGTDPDKAEQLQRAVDAILSGRKRQAVQGTAAVYGPMHVVRDQLDQHPNMWCARNAVIDLDTGMAYDHDPDLLLSVGSEVPYVPGAECPTFDRFLAEALPDPDVQDYVLRIFAMAMLGLVRDQVFPVFIGKGRNGKGMLIRIMHAVFGDMGTVVDPRSLLVARFEKHDEEVARLLGKRLATAEEPTQGAKWNAARIKQWTGGDRLTGSFKGRDSFVFVPSHTLIMASNERPNVELGEDGSFWERYKEVPFTVSFAGRENHDLEPFIVNNELPGVLNRLLAAARSYRENGLQEPHAVSGATQSTRGSSDVLDEFIADCLERTDPEESYIPVGEMYQHATKWWADNGVDQKLPAQARGLFNEALAAALGVDHKDHSVVGRLASQTRERVWFGLRWTGSDGIRPIGQNVLTPYPIVVQGVRTPESHNPLQSATLGLPNLGRISGPAGQNERSTPGIRPNEEPQVNEVLRTDRTDRTDKSINPETKGVENTETHVDHTKNIFSPHVAVPGCSIPSEPSIPVAAPATTKINCGGCGRSINSSGAARHDGLCGRCFKITNPAQENEG